MDEKSEISSIDIDQSIEKKCHRATVSFTQNDLDRLEKLKAALDFSGNAQTLSMAIKLATEIINQQKDGGKVIFENQGRQKEMIIPGLNKT